MQPIRLAPGQPGIQPTWTSSAKTGVGTAVTSSRVWFTLSHGIFNEIYYPRLDQACTRDMGLIVAGSDGFVAEEKRHTNSKVELLAPGIPAYRVTNRCKEGRFVIEKQIVSDPQREAVLQWTRFKPLQGGLEDYQLYVILAPHLGNHGIDNSGWIDDYKGVPMLFAEREGRALALVAASDFQQRSVGYVGRSDGWQDIMQNGGMTWQFDRADSGNIALSAQLSLDSDGTCLVVVGFGNSATEAGHQALATLYGGFDAARKHYIRSWLDWCEPLQTLEQDDSRAQHVYDLSLSLLRAHESKTFSGGLIASLSIPWGFQRSDNNLGGYHLVWARDLALAAGAFIAVGAYKNARRVLHYLRVTQTRTGCWAQNMWLDGEPYWDGTQLDEAALPLVYFDMMRRKNVLADDEVDEYWPMVRRAAQFILKNGPRTDQDRWEENAGYSPYTLATEVVGLLIAAEMAERQQEAALAAYLRETADCWNELVERFTYIEGSDLAKEVGVDGYYIRIAPFDAVESQSLHGVTINIANRPQDASRYAAAEIVSVDALGLVRLGLRHPHDARIRNTVQVIDYLLRKELPQGHAWYRYNEDGYGEQADGSAFSTTGIGRLWPLLTGERAHYEIAAGNLAEARKLRNTMAGFANQGYLLPEQIWDQEDIPEKGLRYGEPAGSAMPLVWAHGEFIKLCQSIENAAVYDTPPQAWQRYVENQHPSPFTIWRFNHRIQHLPAGSQLRVELAQPAKLVYSVNGAEDQTISLEDTALGVWKADIDTANLESGATLALHFENADDFSDQTFTITVV